MQELIESVVPAKRQRDAKVMLALMSRVTGQPPVVERKIIGFGSYHYRYASGREGSAAAAAFAPRKSALVVYLLDGIGAHSDQLARLGPHSSGVGCLYIKDLTEVDQAVLEEIVASSYATLTAGTYTLRARDSGN